MADGGRLAADVAASHKPPATSLVLDDPRLHRA